jgi:uncharacterized protein YndB with AHSA1/START domain
MNRPEHHQTLREDELLIRRWLDAPVPKVFRLWSERAHIIRWWGPKNFTCTHFEMDFRPSGKWRACIVADAYGESWMSGVYSEIVPDRRIAFSFMWEDGPDQPGVPTNVTVTFDAHGDRTLQTFHQSPFVTVEVRDSHVGGWTECFDREAVYLAGVGIGART